MITSLGFPSGVGGKMQEASTPSLGVSRTNTDEDDTAPSLQVVLKVSTTPPPHRPGPAVFSLTEQVVKLAYIPE